jgi:hypothetical protein
MLAVASDSRLAVFVRLVAMVACPVAWIVDLISWVLIERRRRRLYASTTLFCSAGHANDVGPGVYCCDDCGWIGEREHAFAPCCACGAEAVAVPCPCGRLIGGGAA